MMTADVEPHVSDGGVCPGGNPGVSVPEEALTARRRVFAELGVSEDELPELEHNAEFVAGVKRLKEAADAGPPGSMANSPMMVEDLARLVTPSVVGAPVAVVVEGDPLDSEESVPSHAAVVPVAGVEEDLTDYEESE